GSSRCKACCPGQRRLYRTQGSDRVEDREADRFRFPRAGERGTVHDISPGAGILSEVTHAFDVTALIPPSLRALGDRGLLVEFADELSVEINARVRALGRALCDMPGVVEVIPTFRSLLIVLDPLHADRARIADDAMQLAHQLPRDAEGRGRLIELPVVYGGDAGPDLDALAQRWGITAREVVDLHCGHEYVVFMLGFAPGFPYLGILPKALHTPRLPSPRTRVPVGSVAIADELTGVYPLSTSGGWNLIGRTPQRLYDPQAPDPIRCRPGDRVRFTPIASAEFADTAVAAVPLPRPAHPTWDVRKGGLYTTVQDLGRVGYRSLGVPLSGAMDPAALQVANVVVGNAPGAAALECTAPGPVLRALDDITIVITGADLQATLDRAILEQGTAISVRAGQTLSFGAPRAGMWAYVAVAGGLDVATVLGSASAYVPGSLGGVRLRAGDVLGRREGPTRFLTRRPPPLPIPATEATVRVIPGPQDTWFAPEVRAAFYRATFTVSVRSDRAGTRLDGPKVQVQRERMLSDGMVAGAVQVPSGGQPIVIMPDGPTTGGYPKLGVVASADLRLVAQARPGVKIRFVPATLREAVTAWADWEQTVQALSSRV
ncbi:MAG TPA: 5-oxoprolinase subunit PxpB, partial [bacterium]|nr:5-oxoprolinase subunit PxpB [bacterium]